ncbi:DUF262 domain-containing protein [Cellulosimicrobium sp. CpK407]|uniref:DUF262 domain-containing protein n=1 Tax=Cellulosimicrobium sp. CpK407 TaxID=3229847 RepID=UPI003F38BBA3
MALMNVASLAQTGALDLDPKYQRRNRWDRERQSRLIESFILNVPVPPVYLAEEERGRFAVIDGKQRLTAISEFLRGSYRLSGIELLPELLGADFSSLPLDVQGSLSMRPIRAVIVMRNTKPWVKYEVFLRLNTGGEPLNAQEVRNVAAASGFNDLMIELAEHPLLRQQLKIRNEHSRAYADMSDVEYVLRFFTMREDWRRFGGDLRLALDACAQRHMLDGVEEIKGHRRRFLRVLHYCGELWGQHAFQRFDGRQWRDQMIGGLYDAQTVAVDSLTDEQLDALTKRRSTVLDYTKSVSVHPDFDAAIRISTNTPSRVHHRVATMTNMLHAALES